MTSTFSTLFFSKLGTAAFIQVAEAVPLDDSSVDAVVGTLVLCSVQDVNMALKGSLSCSNEVQG